MSVIAIHPKPSQPTPVRRRPFAVHQGDQRIVIRGANWDLYDRLTEVIGGEQHIRVTFDGKDMEIMTTGRLHEDYKGLFGRLIGALTFELAIPCSDAGETTWKRADVARGLEADHCYYFREDKLAADAEARARKSNDVADYPNPDLAIEIDITASEVDRPAIYAALRVEEIWRFDGESVVIEHLGPESAYIAVESSRFLPIRTEEVARWILEEDSSDKLAWERRLREWIRAELAPRLSP
jgi:Uma2 family endonuclease